MSENFTISKNKGFVNITKFSFFTSSLTSQNYEKFLWDFGDGIRSRDKNPTHIYVTPSSYNIVLNAYYGTSSYNVFTQNVEVDLLINNSIYFERVPPPTFAGHLNRYPFKVVITSPNTDDHYIDLYANYSRSYSPQEPENKWSFLRPQWRFLDLDGNQISTIKTNDSFIYADNDGKISNTGLVAGVTGTAEFYFVDDTYNFDLAISDNPHTTIITTLQTSATKSFNDPFNSRPEIPSFSNSLAQAIVPYMVLWRTPDYLRITENGIREHSSPRWIKAKTPLIINPSFKQLEYPDYVPDGNGVSLLRPDQFFTEYLPIDNTTTIPLCAGFSDLSSSFSPQPLQFKYVDETTYKIAGYYKGNLNVSGSAKNVALTAEATFPIPNLSGNYYNPFLWIPNPAAGTLNVVQYTKNNFTDKLFVDNNTTNNQDVAIVQSYEIPIVEKPNFYTDAMAFTGHHGVNCVAVSPLPSYQAWAIDSDIDKLYKFGTNGNILCSINLKTILGSSSSDFVSPAFCAIDGNQNLWITLHDTTSTLKLDSQGNLLFAMNPLTVTVPSTALKNIYRTNLLTYSEDVSNAIWAKSQLTFVSNAEIAPDGTLTADQVIETTSNSQHILSRNYTLSAANEQYTASIYLKAAGRTKASVQWGLTLTPFTRIGVVVDLLNGSFTNSDIGTPTSVTTRSVESVGNGWYRVSLGGIFTTTGTGASFLVLGNNGTTTTYTGDNQSGYYVWGAQLERGPSVTKYIPTEQTTVDFYDYSYLFDSQYYPITANNSSQIDNFIDPTCIDTDSQNNAWVTYSSPFSSYVCKISSNGVVLSAINYPIYSSPTEIVCDNQNNVWIALTDQIYREKSYLEKRNTNGALLSTFGPFKFINHLTIDSNQNPWFTYSYQYIGTISNGFLSSYKVPLEGIYGAIPDWIDSQTYTLIPSAINYLLWNQNFENSYWNKTNVIVDASAAISPIGDATAEAIIENNNILSTYGIYSSAFALTGTHTASIYAQAMTRNFIQLDLVNKNSQTYASAIFNLSTGSLSSILGNAQIFDAGNSWYRCSITGTTTANQPASNSFYINLHNGISSRYVGISATDTIVSGLTGEIYTEVPQITSLMGVFVWGAQVELGSVVYPYVSSTSTQATRSKTDVQIIGNIDDSPLKGIAFDGKNKIFVLNSFENKVLVFDVPTKTFIDNFYINPKGFNFYPSSNMDVIQRDPFLGTIENISNSTKIEYHPWVHSINATGDWSGWRWSNKYKNTSTLNKTITGISKILDFYEKNPYEIFKINENFDLAENMKDLAFIPSLRDSEFLFEKFLKAIFGKNDHQDLGVLSYEKVANFLKNKSDIDECDIDALYSIAASLDLDSDDFRLSYPFLIKRLMDLFSINKSRLWGTKDKSAYNFESTNEFGILNRGKQLTVNYIVTAGVPVLLKTKSLLKYSVIQTGLINSAVYYDLTILSNFLNLGVDWQVNYEYFEYVPVSSNRQIEGVIDWNNENTTIQYELSSFNDWAGNEKIVETSFAYELYKGLKLLNE